MSNVRFCADLHLGHKNMAIRRGFNDGEHHDQHVIERWNSVVHPHDLTFILGDLTFEKADHYYKLDLLNGRKHVVLGNHDPSNRVDELMKYVEKVGGILKYRGLFLTHCPVHESQFKRIPFNIHGHLHENVLDDDRYKCVSMEAIDYVPKLIEELIPHWDNKKYRREYIETHCPKKDRD